MPTASARAYCQSWDRPRRWPRRSGRSQARRSGPVAAGDVQAIAPLTRVCQTVNSLLQARLNPARGQAERPHGALPLRVGDRVIQTRNNYHLGVFNGDTGTLVEVEAASVTVDFGPGDERRVVYAAADVLD